MRLRLTVHAGIFLMFLAVWTMSPGVAQQARPAAPAPRPPAELLRLSLAAETPGLADPFKGITTNGQVEPGLFAIKSTGVSTAPVRQAAEAFLASLSPEQQPQDDRSPWTTMSGASG